MNIQLKKDTDGKLRQRIQIGEHTLFADVTPALGGDDSAPSPHDIFDASLAACKAITLMMYATRRSIPLESVDVEVERDASQESKAQYGLTVKLKFNGDLTESQIENLASVADRCPIHKLMSEATVYINTEVI